MNAIPPKPHVEARLNKISQRKEHQIDEGDDHLREMTLENRFSIHSLDLIEKGRKWNKKEMEWGDFKN